MFLITVEKDIKCWFAALTYLICFHCFILLFFQCENIYIVRSWSLLHCFNVEGQSMKVSLKYSNMFSNLIYYSAPFYSDTPNKSSTLLHYLYIMLIKPAMFVMTAIQIMEHVTHMLIMAFQTHVGVKHQNQPSLKNKHLALKRVMEAPQGDIVINLLNFVQCLYCKYTFK